MEMVLASGALQSVTHGLQVENAKSIEDLAREIEENTEAGDDALIATAMLARQLKCRIEAGEAGPAEALYSCPPMRDGTHRVVNSETYSVRTCRLSAWY